MLSRQLFLQFDGPATVLVQTRGPRLNDVLSGREVDEIANTPRGLTAPQQSSTVVPDVSDISRSVENLSQEIRGISHSVAKIRADGKVEVEEVVRTKDV